MKVLTTPARRTATGHSPANYLPFTQSWKSKFHHSRDKDGPSNQGSLSSTPPPPSAATARPTASSSDDFNPQSIHPTSSYKSEASTLVGSPGDLPVDHGSRRRSSQASHLSALDIRSESPGSGSGSRTHSRKQSADRRLDPLGITVLHTPDNSPTADVVFVHGLGGSSLCTWSRNRDLEFLWPQKWLPLEPVICTARILTFGYNADYLAAGPGSITNISDFAKSLLFQMKFGKDKRVNDLNMGKYPIIFVVHSMGGLVFKKAFTLGLSDNEYKGIVSSVQAVLFLSTPHRGTNLAEILNRILSVSIFNHSPKQYIDELKLNSSTLEDINETFRNHAPSLRIFSFYETLQTPVGIKSIMILNKASSTLGYPGEITDPMNADHHNICKFVNRDDQSYKNIRAVLKTLISSYSEAVLKANQMNSAGEMKQISEMLTTTNAPEDDLASLLYLWRGGTCEAILDEPSFMSWRGSQEGSQVLWLNAAPGSGKSVRMAFLINHLIDCGSPCSYFFFKDGDSTRRSAGSLLRSLAFQIAREVPSFRKALVLLDNNGLKVEKMEARMIWDKLFVGCLFKLDLMEPLYWAIDALDESDSIKTIIGFLSRISTSKAPIRVLIASRKLPEILTAFDRISTTTVNKFSTDNNRDDIRLYAETEIEYMHGSTDFKHEVVNEIVKRSEGNFLWVNLALKEIMQCHSPDDIRNVLAEIPPGMEALYKRMEAGIAGLKKPSDLSLARMILAWATYSRRPLDTEELLQALKPDQPAIIDLRYAASQLCGHFVVIDNSNRVLLVHQTAREYLVKEANLPFSFTAEEIQEELFSRTIHALFDTQRPRSKRQGPIPLHEYAATSWPHHLNRSFTSSDYSLTLLVKFFQSTCVLNWIQTLAGLKKLKVLISASTTINAFIARRKAYELTINPSQHRIKDIDLLEHWAVDLLKVVGKFGGHLIQDPTAISKYIPQLCPQGSAMFQQFGKQTQLSVQGLSDQGWDDCLAKVTVGSGLQALKLVCSTHYLAASTSGCTVVLWDALTFEEFRIISHQEYIFTMCFTDSGELLATYGHETTRIWNVATGRQIHRIVNYPECRALSIKFVEEDSKLVGGLNTRKVVELAFGDGEREWRAVESPFLQEENMIPGAFINSPTALAFNSDAAFIVVAYRAFPLTLWNVEERQRIKRCRRTSNNERNSGMAWSGVMKVIWHPNDEDILGIYLDGIVFKWSPFDDVHRELQSDSNTAPSEIQCSPNGTLFATSDVNGSVKLYNHHYFSLIYQLSSEDIITGLCFSADSKRFFDLRGSYCKVWEPNALVRLLDLDERGCEIDTEAGSTVGSNHPSEAWAASPSTITALATGPKGNIFCTGDSNGLVEIYNTATHERIGTGEASTDMSIDALTWAEKGSHFAYSDGEVITVKTIGLPSQVKPNSSWSCRTLMDIDMDTDSGMIHQILLQADAHFLLVVFENSAQLWSTGSNTLLITVQVKGKQKWTCHPQNEDQLLAFTLDTVTAYTWDGLETCGQWGIENPTPSISLHEIESPTLRSPLIFRNSSTSSDIAGESHEYLDEVIITHSLNFALLLISEQGPSRKRWFRLQILRTALFQDSGAMSSAIPPIFIPEDISAMMEKPLGMLGNDQLVFLDKSFWVCSWRLDQYGKGSANESATQRHFFLPRDWVNAEVLGLCRLMADGTILCPRKGDVAVIRSSLGSPW